ncbi:hypothetical protein [Salinibacterium sp. ZJ454]|uniref:hypothetical protein n=1 Tax=Salinibacterium sp. ZJ454 TaxID=2708339 RepID=UPI001422E69F|nr:hypothetical protein [Salinibacterium sp. ZJ454]
MLHRRSATGMMIAAAAILAIGYAPSSALGAEAYPVDSVAVTSVDVPAGDSDESVYPDYNAAVDLMSQYWATHFSEFVSGAYVPPNLYSGNEELGIGLYDAPAETVYCGSFVLTDQNAWYCLPEDFIAFDIDLMDRALTVGDAFIYFIVAHEWGHAIQARVAPAQRDPRIELQADCLAGAALQGMVNDGTLVFEEGDSEELSVGIASLGDPWPWANPTDHGSADERLGQFNRGVQFGVADCLQPGY